MSLEPVGHLTWPCCHWALPLLTLPPEDGYGGVPNGVPGGRIDVGNGKVLAAEPMEVKCPPGKMVSGASRAPPQPSLLGVLRKVQTGGVGMDQRKRFFARRANRTVELLATGRGGTARPVPLPVFRSGAWRCASSWSSRSRCPSFPPSLPASPACRRTQRGVSETEPCVCGGGGAVVRRFGLPQLSPFLPLRGVFLPGLLLPALQPHGLAGPQCNLVPLLGESESPCAAARLSPWPQMFQGQEEPLWIRPHSHLVQLPPSHSSPAEASGGSTQGHKTPTSCCHAWQSELV